MDREAGETKGLIVVAPNSPAHVAAMQSYPNRYVTCKQYMIFSILYVPLDFRNCAQQTQTIDMVKWHWRGVCTGDVGHKPYAWLLGATI